MLWVGISVWIECKSCNQLLVIFIINLDLIQ